MESREVLNDLTCAHGSVKLVQMGFFCVPTPSLVIRAWIGLHLRERLSVENKSPLDKRNFELFTWGKCWAASIAA